MIVCIYKGGTLPQSALHIEFPDRLIQAVKPPSWSFDEGKTYSRWAKLSEDEYDGALMEPQRNKLSMPEANITCEANGDVIVRWNE